METSNIRISNLPRDELADLWRNLSTEGVNKLIFNSNEKEISLLFGHMSEPGILHTLDALEPQAINKIFSVISPRTANKILMFVNSKMLSKLVSGLKRNLLLKIIKNSSSDIQNKILKTLPSEQRKMFLEISEEDGGLDNDYKYYLSEKFENSIEKDSLNRIKELEERERYIERRQQAREEQYSTQLDYLRQQISDSEKEIYSRQNKFKNIESGLLKKEQEIKENIRILQEEHQKQVQEKIEVKVPEFVKSAIEVLEKKEKDFATKAQTWNNHGSIALCCAIASSLGALVYGGFEFNSAAQENIDWFFFSFLILKGLIVVALFGAFAKHAYNVGNAYMHESLKRSDRMHAINFGKLYLEVYGNDVSQNDMKAIFENWNLDSDSAFTKVQSTNFEPKVVEQVTQMIKAVASVTNNDDGVKKGDK